MLIQYLSDIHLEFMTKVPKIKVMADVLCLAGDIGYPYSGIYKNFLIEMNKSFKKVFLIAGNHEYYNSDKYSNHSMDDVNTMIKSLIKFHKLDNITFLNNSYELYNDIIFVGTTLWSNIQSQNMNDICLMNDFKQIENMTYDNYKLLHKRKEQSIFELIDSSLSFFENVYIIDSYRDPIERKISEFFEKIGSYHFNNEDNNMNNYNVIKVIKMFGRN